MNKNVIFWLLLAAVSTASAPLLGAESDEAPAKPTSEAKENEGGDEDPSALLNAAKLRDRVRGMRKQVLGGGPAVVKSESEALRFYRGKIHEMARRADELRTQRDSKEAEYRVALDTTLKSEDPAERAEAAREAQQLRSAMRDLDDQIAEIEKRGESLGRGVEGIQRRIDKRKRLLSNFDRSDIVEDLPYLDDEVLGGEEDEAGGGGNPWGDEGFIQDLLRTDPEAARRLLYEADPAAYWKRFPLKPTAKSLRKALPFPPADLPGNR
ncbi:MAG: hypothetical protein ACYTGZ_05220 [Planctomycetota bacterium]|jgi:hypothetical protein